MIVSLTVPCKQTVCMDLSGIHIFPYSAIVATVLENGWALTLQETIQCKQYLMLTILTLSLHELLGDLQNTSPGETLQILVICFLHCITCTNRVLSANNIRLTAVTCEHNRIHSQKKHIQKQWLIDVHCYTKHFT